MRMAGCLTILSLASVAVWAWDEPYGKVAAGVLGALCVWGVMQARQPVAAPVETVDAVAAPDTLEVLVNGVPRRVLAGLSIDERTDDLLATHDRVFPTRIHTNTVAEGPHADHAAV